MTNKQKQAIRSAVGYLENVYIDNPAESPITLQNAIDYCYEYVKDDIHGCGESQAIFFQGKEAIREELQKQIKKNSFIKLK